MTPVEALAVIYTRSKERSIRHIAAKALDATTSAVPSAAWRTPGDSEDTIADVCLNGDYPCGG